MVEIGTPGDDVDMLTARHTDLHTLSTTARVADLRSDLRLRVALGCLASAVVLLTTAAFG